MKSKPLVTGSAPPLLRRVIALSIRFFPNCCVVVSPQTNALCATVGVELFVLYFPFLQTTN
jgi:hypothetical protein